MHSARVRQRNLIFLLGLSILQACALSRTAPQTATDATTSQTPVPPAEMEIARGQIAKLQDRVQDLEMRLSALNDKINLENGTATPNTLKLPNEVVETPAAHSKVIPVKTTERKKPNRPAPAVGSAEDKSSSSSSEAVDRYREAKILYDSKRYSDSVLEFAEFVKNESDHPLAAAAQYFVGMSYYQQNEYKLAEEELSRGLIAYSHSAYVPDTLLALAEISVHLNKPTKVAYYREKLMNHFPNSPQAKKFSDGKSPTNADTDKPATVSAQEDKRETASEKNKTASAKSTPFTVEKVMESAEEPSVVAAPRLPETPSVSAPAVESEGP